MTPTSLFLTLGFISAPAAAVVFADLEIEIRQICQYGNDDTHQHADSVTLLGAVGIQHAV